MSDYKVADTVAHALCNIDALTAGAYTLQYESMQRYGKKTIQMLSL
jgi:hypothetical protein